MLAKGNYFQEEKKQGLDGILCATESSVGNLLKELFLQDLSARNKIFEFLKLETFYIKKTLWSKTLHQCLSCSWNSFGDVDAVFNSTHAWVLQGLWFWRHEIKITSEPRSVCRILCFFLLKARNISNKENALVENVLHENATSMLVLHWIAFGDVGTVFKSTHAWVLQEFWFWEHEIMIISQPRSICSMLI